VIAGAATAALGQALVAYDGFGGGPLPDLAKHDGGKGWAGPWEANLGKIPTALDLPGLTYPGLAAEPGQAITGPGSDLDMTDYFRPFGEFPGHVLYASVLMRPDAGFARSYVLRFGEFPNTCDIGLPPGSDWYGMQVAGYLAPSGVAPKAGSTVLLVVEIEYSMVVDGTEYRLYVNPRAGEPQPPEPDASFYLAGNIPLGRGVELLGQANWSLDELRVGTDWAGVLPGPACYANCDGSVIEPVLNVLDFNCFLNRFAAGEAYANCDGSTAAPVLNVLDFNCFLNRFVRGCPR
jgi:hypothetical protein